MKSILLSVVFLAAFYSLFAQTPKPKDPKYPSLLWEIKGKGNAKPSYLFGTMHVSSKVAFYLSDSFYLGIKNADVVGLETNPETWQQNMSRYDFAASMGNGYWNGQPASANDFLKIGTLRFEKADKLIQKALSSNPSIINNLLYRANSYGEGDFEEDTYLDMHIFQAGKKWGKKIAGVEDFDESMRLMMEAYVDAAKDEKKNERTTDIPEEFSSYKLQQAYRAGNLDLIDTITKLNSTSAAFDEKFLYVRNELQATSIDSILKSGSTLFVGVGAAHLAGHRGVIELLRKKGYKLRPIKMSERDSRFKEEVEKIRVPVTFASRTVSDSFITVQVPGKLFPTKIAGIEQQQFADMANGSYYMVSRVPTNAALWGATTKDIVKQVDSVLYENIPGKIISKKSITKNGYNGFDLVNRTRRGDVQRYQIFITPFEVLLFKMSGPAEYVTGGTEAATFFNSITFKEIKPTWAPYTPAYGGFGVSMPHQPYVIKRDNWQYAATDAKTGATFQVLRTDVHNYDFVEEDTFDLNLMEESFAASEFIEKNISKAKGQHAGLPALNAAYQHKDGSVSQARFLIHGPHYYTLVVHEKKKTDAALSFLNSFEVKPFLYAPSKKQSDTIFHYTVNSPVSITIKELEDLPFDLLGMYNLSKKSNNDDSLYENGDHKDAMIANDTTGEKIYVEYYKAPKYYFDKDSTWVDYLAKEAALENWKVRMLKQYTLPEKIRVWEYIVSDSNSSRAIWSKLIYRNGMAHMLTTQIDTAAKQSAFLTDFFSSFMPDKISGENDVYLKKSALYFADFFSTDSVQHKRAVKNIYNAFLDSTDFKQLKKSIQSLTWKEKLYVDVKKNFINKLGEIKTAEATNYLKDLYAAAGDTLDLQHTVLENLLRQQTAYSFQTFKNIVVNDPPVLNVDSYNYNSSIYKDDNDDGLNGTFMDELSDSLQLSAGIFKEVLPLLNIDDYKEPVMQLLSAMVDSNLVAAADYAMYMQKFLLEAKQEWKKQSILEKNKSIEEAQKTDEDENDYDEEKEDYGNSKLNRYATLLLPFWDTNPAVATFIKGMLKSNDKRFKYNLAYLLLRKNKPLPDTLLSYYAGLKDYTYELYTDLVYLKRQQAVPNGFKDQIGLAKSKLINDSRYDSEPDTLLYLDKTRITYRGKTGHFYFFKYKNKKTDNAWKIATAGMVPADGNTFEFMDKNGKYIDYDFDFTGFTESKLNDDEPLKPQLQKAMQRQMYAKRKSGEAFYEESRTLNYPVED